MTSIRFVVVDTSLARLYEFDVEPVGFRLVDELVNEGYGRHERDLVSARAGRRRNPASGQRQVLAPVTTARVHALETFARRVSRWLDGVVRASESARIVLVAAPRLLGVLRPAFTRRVREHVVVTVPKDLANADRRELQRNLLLAVRRVRELEPPAALRSA